MTTTRVGHNERVLHDPELWIWDSWVADDGDRYHLFFLKAPSALIDPARRHEAARIGHASSTDLVHWEVHEDALAPGEHGGFDDLALWTGSVARGPDGTWRMYYTALNTSRGYGVRDQQIGLAESDDLFTWRRVGAMPLVAPDPALYKTVEGAVAETWRDPFVFEHDGLWHMLITARDPVAPRLYDGVIGHAVSEDMVRWDLQPPVCAPAGFGQTEVAQVRRVHDRWLLSFTCDPEEQSEEQQAVGHFCTWQLELESPLGPIDLRAARPYRTDPKLFAAPLVQTRAGEWVYLGFRNTESEGVLAFHIIDPLPVA
jgi:beta-fructofuranosidase